MFLNDDNVGAERIPVATGPATQNARLPSCSVVLGTIKSPRAAERRMERLGTVKTGLFGIAFQRNISRDSSLSVDAFNLRHLKDILVCSLLIMML